MSSCESDLASPMMGSQIAPVLPGGVSNYVCSTTYLLAHGVRQSRSAQHALLQRGTNRLFRCRKLLKKERSLAWGVVASELRLHVLCLLAIARVGEDGRDGCSHLLRRGLVGLQIEPDSTKRDAIGDLRLIFGCAGCDNRDTIRQRELDATKAAIRYIHIDVRQQWFKRHKCLYIGVARDRIEP